MKKTRNFFVTTVLLCMIMSCASLDLSSRIENKSSIQIDKVAFEEGQLMDIKDEQGNILASYERFENPSYEVQSVRIYNEDKSLIYSLVPVINNPSFEIHIMDQDKKKSLVSMKFAIKGLTKVEGDSVVDFYDMPYDIDFSTAAHFMSVENNIALRNSDKILMAKHSTVSLSGADLSPLFVDSTYLNENKDQAVCWAMIIKLLEEISENENAKNQSAHSGSSNFHGSNNHAYGGMNTNGTFNNNGNPYDSF